MIFSIQRFLEDHFSRRGLADTDQYAIRLANLFGRQRVAVSEAAFRRSMQRVRTVFFRRNAIADRRAFELSLLRILDSRFQEKNPNSLLSSFPGGVRSERARVRSASRLSVSTLLESFRTAVEARAVDSFWRSRRQGKLHRRAEAIGQALLAVFLRGVLRQRTGLVLREMASGVGWVDIALVISSVPHLMELKVIRGPGVPGVEQLDAYMQTERRREGWLVLFDARTRTRRAGIPAKIGVRAGVVRTLSVDVNPEPPSRR